MSPALWASWTPRATSAIIATFCSRDNSAAAFPSVSPLMSCMAMYSFPSTSPVSYIPQMLGWCIFACALASKRNLLDISGSAPLMNLSATLL